MAYQHHLALVINKHTLSESDLSITLLTENLGKITALAKNAKKIKSQRLSNLQLGNLVKVYLYQKTDRYWLSESHTISAILHHSKNLPQLSLLFYLLEFINRLTPENQPTPFFFETCQSAIRAIDRNQYAHFIAAEIKLLNLLGYGPPIEITKSYTQKKYSACQKLICLYLESISEKPFYSPSLFNK